MRATTLVKPELREAAAATAPVKLSTPEAAEYLGCSPATLSTWRCLGKGPEFVKLGGKIVYIQKSLDAYLESRSTNCTSSIED